MDCYDAYREPPQGCGTTIIGIIVIALIAAMLFFSGCKTVQPLTQSRDSVRVEVRHDSVYIFRHDSIFRDRWRAGDTVFITVEKYKTLYRDKLIELHDTITDTHTDVQVQQVRYVPKYYRFTSWAFWIVVAMMLIRLAWWIAKKYYCR